MAELILKTEPVAIIETGTYRGTTTEWLSAFHIPVYSCEASAENYGFARARLGSIPNVHLLHADSRQAIRQLLRGKLSTVEDRVLFFYLDAHWNDDLPLAEEIELIFSIVRNAVVLVDDFQVPDDPGYCYDDYGPGKALTPDYISDVARRHELRAFYPATPSERETGAKRGCVVLVRGRASVEIEAKISLLRPLSGTID